MFLTLKPKENMLGIRITEEDMIIFFFVFIHVSIRISLYVSRLILLILKFIKFKTIFLKKTNLESNQLNYI